MINSPALSWIHTRLSVLHPFLPSPSTPGFTPNPQSWRPSTLPRTTQRTHTDKDFDVPNSPHLWLPVDPADRGNDFTPASLAAYDAFGAGWKDWRLGAQQHYSFFTNLEAGGVHGYEFWEWDMNYERLSINFIGVWGRDVLDAGEIPRDDEQFLTVTHSKRTGRRELSKCESAGGEAVLTGETDVVVAGRAVVCHFAFFVQREGMERTDILGRYRALAGERCPGGVME